MKHFWDLDGFMFDFDGHFEDLFGRKTSEFDNNKKEMWRLINTVPTFFLDIPLMKGAREFYNEYHNKLNPMFLTSCPDSNYENVAMQKRRAVYRHFGKYNLVLPVRGSENKPLFMHQPGDILIDDWGKNTRAWEAAGGTAIKHENFEQTAAELEWHLYRLHHHNFAVGAG